jgi:hypothetical protein
MSTNCHAILAERDNRFLNVTVAKLWVCQCFMQHKKDFFKS